MSSSPESRLHFLDYWRTIRVRKGLIGLIFLLVVVTVGVLTYLSPKEYLSFATIEVQSDMTPVRINNTQTEVSNLFTITSGSRPPELVSLLNSDRFKQLLATAKEWFDVVLLDCPPLLGLSDATIVCSMTEGTIIVARHRRFPRSMLIRVKGLLTSIDAHILGVVLNNVDVRQDPAYQYYTSYSKYYTGTKKKGSSPITPVTSGRTYQPPSSNGSKSGTTTTISRISTKRPSFSGPEPRTR